MSKKYKYRCNKIKLFNASDPNIAYIAGLLNTDGFFRRKADGFEISLTGESEYKLLAQIKKYIETDAPIKNYNGSWRLGLGCDGIKQFMHSAFNIQ